MDDAMGVILSSKLSLDYREKTSLRATAAMYCNLPGASILTDHDGGPQGISLHFGTA
jgi:hypothetical protein